MWDILRPILIIAFILFLVFTLSRACVEETGAGYYHSYYPGFIYGPGGRYYYDDRVRVRGGK